MSEILKVIHLIRVYEVIKPSNTYQSTIKRIRKPYKAFIV